jgi:DNA polymerase III delta prime subunit
MLTVNYTKGHSNMAKKEQHELMPQVGPVELAEGLKIAIPAHINVLVSGSPGIGKTDIITAVCKDVGYRCLIAHPVVSDPTDFKGMPWVVKNGDGEMVAEFIPFGELKKLMDTTEPTVMFFDDLGQAPPVVQADVMQLLLAGELNGKRISDEVTFVAATNRKQDKAAVSGILEPVKSRFGAIVELTVDNDAWHDWGLKNKLDLRLLYFIRFKRDLLCKFEANADMTQSPIPRCWAFVDRWLKAGIKKDVRLQWIAGSVGMGAAKEFVAFLDVFEDLPNLSMLETNPDKVEVPPRDRYDVMYAVCSAVVAKAKDKNMDNIMRYVRKWPIEFQALFIHDIEQMKPSCMETKSYVKWVEKNGDLAF